MFCWVKGPFLKMPIWKIEKNFLFVSGTIC